MTSRGDPCPYWQHRETDWRLSVPNGLSLGQHWTCGVCHPPPFPDKFDDRLFTTGEEVKTRVLRRPPEEIPPEPTGYRGDAARARLAADRAIARAGRNAPPDWMAKALDAVRYLCRIREEFTTDAVWHLVGPPPEPRALGAVMRQAKQEGLCVPTERHHQSTRPECHARPLRVWRSLSPSGRSGRFGPSDQER